MDRTMRSVGYHPGPGIRIMGREVQSNRLAVTEDRSGNPHPMVNTGGMRGHGFNEPFPQTTGRNMHLRQTMDMMNGQSFKRAPLGAISQRSADPLGPINHGGMNDTRFYQSPPMATTNSMTSDTMTTRRGLASMRTPSGPIEDRSKPNFGQLNREGTNAKCFYQPPPMASATANDTMATMRGLEADRTPIYPIDDHSIDHFSQPNRNGEYDYGFYERSVQMREANYAPSTAMMNGLPPDRAPIGPIEGSSNSSTKKVKKKGKRSKRSKKAECGSAVDQKNLAVDALEKSVQRREANTLSTPVMKGLPLERAPLGPIKGSGTMTMTPQDFIEERTINDLPKPDRKSVHDYGFYEKSVQMREPNTPSAAMLKGLPTNRAPIGPIKASDAMAMRSDLAPEKTPLGPIEDRSIDHFAKPNRKGEHDYGFYERSVKMREANYAPSTAIMKGLLLDKSPLGPIEGSSTTPSKKVNKQEKPSKRSKKAECGPVVDQKNLAIDHETEDRDEPFDIYAEVYQCNARGGPSMADDFLDTMSVEETYAYESGKVKTLEEDLAELKAQTEADIENLAAQFEIELDTLSTEESDVLLGNGECTGNHFHMTTNIHSSSSDSSNIHPTRKEVEQEDTTKVVTEVLPKSLHIPTDAAHGPTDHGATGDASLQPKLDIYEDSKNFHELSKIKEDDTFQSISTTELDTAALSTQSEADAPTIQSKKFTDQINTVNNASKEAILPAEQPVREHAHVAMEERKGGDGVDVKLSTATEHTHENKREVLMSTTETQTDITEEDLNAQNDVDDMFSENTRQRYSHVPRFKKDIGYESEEEVVAQVEPTHRSNIERYEDDRSGECMKDMWTMTTTTDKIIASINDGFNGGENWEFENKREVLMSTIETQTDITEEDLNAQNDVDDIFSENTSQRDVNIEPVNNSFGNIMDTFTDDRRIVKTDESGVDTIMAVASLTDSFTRLMKTRNTNTCISTPTTIANGTRFTIDDTNANRYQNVDDKFNEFIKNKVEKSRPSESYVYTKQYHNDTDNRKYTESTKIPHPPLTERPRLLYNGNKNTRIRNTTTNFNGTRFTRDDTNADRYPNVDYRSISFTDTLETNQTRHRKPTKDAGISSGTQTGYSTVFERNARHSKSYVDTEQYQNGKDNKSIHVPRFKKDMRYESEKEIGVAQAGPTHRINVKIFKDERNGECVKDMCTMATTDEIVASIKDVFYGAENWESAKLPQHTLNERQRLVNNGSKTNSTRASITIANGTRFTTDDTNANRYQIVSDKSDDFTNKLESKATQYRRTPKGAGISSGTQTVYSIAKEVSQRNHRPSKFDESVDACDERWNRYIDQPWHDRQQGDGTLKENRPMNEENSGEHIFKNLKLDLPVVAGRSYRLYETTTPAMPNDYQDLDTDQQERRAKYRIDTPPCAEDAEETGCCGCFTRNSKRSANTNNSCKSSRGNKLMRFFRRVKACFT